MIQIVCFLCIHPQISNISKRFTLQKQIPRLFPIEAVKFVSIWVWNISSILSLQLLLSLSLLYIFRLLWLFFSYLFLQLYYAIMSKGSKEQTQKILPCLLQTLLSMRIQKHWEFLSKEKSLLIEFGFFYAIFGYTTVNCILQYSGLNAPSWRNRKEHWERTWMMPVPRHEVESFGFGVQVNFHITDLTEVKLPT